MNVYRLTPEAGAPVLRCAASLRGATARALREFPAGLRSVEPLGLRELAQLAAEGVPLPVAARQRLQLASVIQREKAKADARMQAVRDGIRDKAREAARVKRDEERARKDAEKAQRKAERAAEKRRKLLAERRAKKQAEKAAQEAAAVVPVHAVPPAAPTDSRMPWED